MGSRIDHNDDSKCKSKNLDAERRRRKKLRDRLLQLRSLVPNITNMNNATTITGAITYIEKLKMSVEELSNQLLQMKEATFDLKEINDELKEIDCKHEDNKCGIKVDVEVQVSHISGTNKLWIRMVFEKKRGALTELMEAISFMGIDLNDTTITTTRGALLFTSFGEGSRGRLPEADQMKKYLLEIIKSF